MKFVNTSFPFVFGRIAGTLFCFLLLFLISESTSAQGSNFAWGRSFGTAGTDQGKSIQVENTGNIYLTGSFQDSIAFDSTIVLHSQGGSDVLLAKLNSHGKAKWAISIGNTGEEEGLQLSLGEPGFLYLSGSFSSSTLDLGNYTLTNSDTAGTDIFLAKLDTAGTLLWAKTIGAAGADMPTALGTDGYGNTYLSGYFSADSLAIDTISLINYGGEDFFLAKHDPNGNVLWAARSGTLLNDRSSALAVDSVGNCLLTGYFTGDSLFFASDTITHADSLASPDIFLLKYNPDGLEEWAKSADTDSTDLSTAISLDADGYIYLAGKTRGAEIRFDSVKVTNTATEALFLVRMNPEGQADWEATAQVTGTASGFVLTEDMYGYLYLMTGFSGQLQFENLTYHDSTGSRLVFPSYTIFRDFMGSKEATGNGLAKGYGVASNDDGSCFATGAFSDSLYFGNSGLAVYTDSVIMQNQDLFVSSLSDSIGSGGAGGGGGNGGSGYCQMIREVVSPCSFPGDEVLIRGLFRGKPSAVSFGGIPAQIVHRTFISVTAIVPATYAGGPVAVTVGSCTDTAAFGLQPIVTATASAQSLCANTSLMLTATGADIYNWSTGQTDSVITVSPVGITEYTVTGTIGSCEAEASVVVNVDTVLAGLTVQAPVQPVCAGSTVTLVAQGASNYSWSTGHLSDSITVTLSADSVFYVIANAGACTDTIEVTMTVMPMPSVTVSPAPASICIGDSVTLTASGAASYSWWGAGADSSITVSPASTTSYTVTGSNGSCSDTATATVQVHSASPLPIISGSTTLCEGETLQLIASGGSLYTWSGPGGFSSNQSVISLPNATLANAGIYSVQPVDNFCQSSVATIQVQINPVPVLTLTPQVQTIVPGTSVTITASGAAAYLWQPGSDTGNVLSVAPVVTTQYQVAGTTAGCTATATATVNVAPLSISAGPDQVLCGQTSATLSASISPATVSGSWSVLSGAGGSFSDISSPTAVFSGLAGQHYLLQWQANGASDSTASATVKVHFEVMPGLPEVAPVFVCENTPAIISTSGDAPEFNWFEDLSQQPVANGASFTTPVLTSETVYYVTAGNEACETDPVAVTVGIHPRPVVVAGPDVTIVQGKQVRLHASGAAKYVWTPTEGLTMPKIAEPIASPEITTTYTVTGFSEQGCRASDMVTVTVLPAIKPANVFTPNGDGVNDFWDISALVENYPDCRVEVLNRWGNSVYSSRDYQTPWDGKSNGNDLPDGTYFFIIDPGNEHEPIKGMVVLLR